MWLALLLLLGLTAVTVRCVRERPTGFHYMLLAAMSVGWLLTNGPVEGATLIELSTSHGVTVADLATVAAWATVMSARVWPAWAAGEGTNSNG
jgi:hypothetical protein